MRPEFPQACPVRGRIDLVPVPERTHEALLIECDAPDPQPQLMIRSAVQTDDPEPYRVFSTICRHCGQLYSFVADDLDDAHTYLFEDSDG